MKLREKESIEIIIRCSEEYAERLTETVRECILQPGRLREMVMIAEEHLLTKKRGNDRLN